MKNIPYARQYVDDDDIEAVVSALKSDYLTTGPLVPEFERAVADFSEAGYAAAVSNGTAALHAACFAAGIGEDDEVITSAITFAASANACLYMGAKPVFADIDAKTYNIDCGDIRKKITSRTKAIIPVDFTGQPADMDEVLEIADEFGLTVIEDSAHALGAIYKNKKIGNVSHMTTLSFHPVKHITTGEGGMVLTNDEKFYKRLLLFRTHGITRDKSMMENYEGPWYYEQLELGYNYRMTDIQAALGISQLKKLPLSVKRRSEIARMYTEAFKDCQSITVPFVKNNRESAWHLYVILVNNREEVFMKLRQAGILCNVHYVPVYRHPYYRKNGYEGVSLENSENFYKRAISLPMYYGITDEEINFVIENVRRIAGGCCMND